MAYNVNPHVPVLLLDKGADIDARDGDERTPLHRASEAKNREMKGLLIDRGADIDARDEDGETPLHLVANTHFEIVQKSPDIAGLLIDKGADVNALNDDYYTPPCIWQRDLPAISTL